MSKRKRKARPASKPAHRSPARRRPQRSEPDLIEIVADELASDEPLGLLALGSSLLSAVDPRCRSPFERHSEDDPDREEMVESLLSAPLLETSALLTVIAALSGDEVLRRRAAREVAERGHSLPAWLTDLHRAVPGTEAAELADPFGDGANVMISVTLPGGHPATAVVLVDHNSGSIVRDSFVLPDALATVVDQATATGADLGLTVHPISPADARVRIDDAVDRGAITIPPVETETWPNFRPLVEWMAALQPAGGDGFPRPEWSDADLADLTRRFRASPFAADVDDPGDLLSSLLWFGTDYGPGDPMRWSPTAAEILLLDWIPRKIVAGVDDLEPAPDLLRAFVRFCHDERGIPAELTELTLDAIDEFDLEYQQLIRSDRPQGPAALLAGMGLGLPEHDDAPSPREAALALERLRRQVGGAAALDALDADPLPDEPFAWDAVPADVHDRVREVLDLVDRCCDTMFYDECRTACRRLLADVAAGDPVLFRRRARPEPAAATICWIVGKANELFAPYPSSSSLQVKELAEYFGMASSAASPRSGAFLKAIGVEHRAPLLELGTPRYLVGEHRAELLEMRDYYLTAAD